MSYKNYNGAKLVNLFLKIVSPRFKNRIECFLNWRCFGFEIFLLMILLEIFFIDGLNFFIVHLPYLALIFVSKCTLLRSPL